MEQETSNNKVQRTALVPNDLNYSFTILLKVDDDNFTKWLNHRIREYVNNHPKREQLDINLFSA